MRLLVAFRGGTCHPINMARESNEVWVQLATRIPKPLHRELKLQCVRTEISVMAFVVAAIRDKLVRDQRRERPAKNAPRVQSRSFRDAND